MKTGHSLRSPQHEVVVAAAHLALNDTGEHEDGEIEDDGTFVPVENALDTESVPISVLSGVSGLSDVSGLEVPTVIPPSKHHTQPTTSSSSKAPRKRKRGGPGGGKAGAEPDPDSADSFAQGRDWDRESKTYDGLARQALPVAAYPIKGDPVDGLEYLRTVRDQALLLPTLFTSNPPLTTTPSPELIDSSSAHPLLLQARLAAAATLADQAIIEATDKALLPPKGWKKKFLGWFRELATELRRRRADSGRPQWEEGQEEEEEERDGEDEEEEILVEDGEPDDTGFWVGAIRVDMSGFGGLETPEKSLAGQEAMDIEFCDALEPITQEAGERPQASVSADTEMSTLPQQPPGLQIDPLTGMGLWQPVPPSEQHPHWFDTTVGMYEPRSFDTKQEIHGIERARGKGSRIGGWIDNFSSAWSGAWRIVDAEAWDTAVGADHSNNEPQVEVEQIDPTKPLYENHRVLEHIRVPDHGDDGAWKWFLYGVKGRKRMEKEKGDDADDGEEPDAQRKQDGKEESVSEVPPYVSVVSRIDQRSTFHLLRLHHIWLPLPTVCRSSVLPTSPSTRFFTWLIALLANLDHALLTGEQWSVVRDLVRGVRELRRGMSSVQANDNGEEMEKERKRLARLMNMVVAVIAGWYGQADLGDAEDDGEELVEVEVEDDDDGVEVNGEGLLEEDEDGNVGEGFGEDGWCDGDNDDTELEGSGGGDLFEIEGKSVNGNKRPREPSLWQVDKRAKREMVEYEELSFPT
ncbi:hypothetical protein HDU93_000588 [Gonapodya sp. JEL0774]|nr:hypothetical protein HDU93_000588 [Gonapodya sp. JEL0774]